jgi:hypothetical protein
MELDIHVKTNIISKSESQAKTDENIIGHNPKPDVKIEIEDFDFTEKYDLPQIIGEKRKNNEFAEMQTKKLKEEFVVFEECSDHQLKAEPTDEETDDKVFKYS